MSKTSSQSGTIILASGSRSRRDMLTAAGLSFTVKPADVDEGFIKQAALTRDASADPAGIAKKLAIAKAQAVSQLMPGALVIGADQILAMDGQIFDKPVNMAEAKERLLAMRGKVHQLHAGVAVAHDGEVVWSTIETAHMSVRSFSTKFLVGYLDRAGDQILQSVGAYQLEGLGVQLFDKISGDYFTILGMPLLPLLDELRRREMNGL